MTTPAALRERASNIRQAALGFTDEVSRTLVELAEGLEADARRLEEERAADAAGDASDR
jgi:O-methyltransferase involved in polyketide biosynthesis